MFILCYSKINHHICSAQQFYTYNTVRLDKLAFFAGVFYVRIFGSTIKILVSVYPRVER
uniref:Uncharacterized protein n=1 Tax=Siphoviridae sp. ctWlk2 TaxID=2825539 RepID=A0A8S5U6L2_9CAUD|nr:MAG TPA: hypothetical protein [Siphoviridae sp. ctWlk2]